MTYRSDRQIVQDLLPICLFIVVIAEGIDDPNGKDAQLLLHWLAIAQDELLAGVPEGKAESIIRRTRRAIELVKKPFVEANAAVAKFGLCVYYLLNCLRENAIFVLEDDSPLDKAITAILAPDGTITEFANIDKVDVSAQKQARHMLTSLQADGYFRGIVWE